MNGRACVEAERVCAPFAALVALVALDAACVIASINTELVKFGINLGLGLNSCRHEKCRAEHGGFAQLHHPAIPVGQTVAGSPMR